MDKLLDAVLEVVCLVSPEKVRAIAGRIRQTDAVKAASALSGAVSTPGAAEVVNQLLNAWRMSAVSAGELASMLLAASHVFTKASSQQSIELVWTGPTTPVVSARRTEQALLQVINAAEQTLFVISFVAYDVSAIVNALNAAAARGVAISMLLEPSKVHGGSISFDAIGKMSALVPSANLYAWRDKSDQFSGGSVHAKVAVADDKICFITSANLTGYAMEKNMEAGVLVTEGHIPNLLREHLQSLVDTKTVTRIWPSPSRA